MFILFSAVWLFVTIAKATQVGPPLLFGLLMATVGGLLFWQSALMPRRIIRHADGRIEFVCLARSVMLTPREIVSIRPDRRQFGFLVLKHESGKLRLLNQFTGFHELLTYIESVNPAVELYGC